MKAQKRIYNLISIEWRTLISYTHHYSPGVGFLDGRDKASKPQTPNRFPTFSKPGKSTISSIVGGYKSAVTKHCNRLGLEFKWQSRFHDHIIRNEQSYHTITEYIINYPKNWKGYKSSIIRNPPAYIIR